MNKLIYINKSKKEFHLNNGSISYIFKVIPNINQLESVYFGKAVHIRSNLSNLNQYKPVSGCQKSRNSGIYSLEHINQEYPTYGTTDFRKPAFIIQYPDGDKISEFKYQNYVINSGAPNLGVLPHVRYCNDAQTLTIHLKDTYSNLKLSLNYTIFSNLDCIIRNAVFTNPNDQAYNILSAKSASLDLPSTNYDLITLNGAWARERHVSRAKIRTGIQEIGSTRGATGHIHDPFIGLAEPNTTQDSGNALGMSLIYSGNHQETIEVNTYGVTRIMSGINDTDFNWILQPHSSFTTPQAALTFSYKGLNQLSQNFHKLILNHIINKRWQKPIRPVLINNWEATYYNFDEQKLLNLAQEAKSIGCNLFVLDDGWFGNRTSDSGSMGDWIVDHSKLPKGMNHLVKELHKLNMQFGLWFEPEAITEDTKLFQIHPDWRLGTPNKRLSTGRNEYLLDFANPNVVDALFQKISSIIKKVHPNYIKWDMNRNITEPYSNYLTPSQQGETLHRYILGVYELYKKLTEAYPNILFESCAGGGGRFDMGLFYYAPQAWTSDDTDAYERWKIQTGTSYVYPPAVMGAHVSIVPNHQTGRITPLKSRASIALFGTFGYEFDLTKLTQKEKEELKSATNMFSHFHSLIFKGNFYRLASPQKPVTGWESVSENKQHAIVLYFNNLITPNDGLHYLKLSGLNPQQLYEINKKRQLYGDELMNIGLPLGQDYCGHEEDYWNLTKRDFNTELFELKAISDKEVK